MASSDRESLLRDWEERTFSFLDRMFFRPSGATLILAVSGGADSMALLEFWARAGAFRYGCRLRAVHVHHGLRQAADADQALVESRCRELSVPLEAHRLDPATRRSRESVEMWARRERYRCFSAAAASAVAAASAAAAKEARGAGPGSAAAAASPAPPVFVLTGHHRDDLVETVFQRLHRGTGAVGLGGIPFRRAPGIVRPFLSRGRAELEAYLRLLGRAWREDESNSDLRIGRNWFRHRFLPLLRKEEPDLDARILAVALDLQGIAARLGALEEDAGLLRLDDAGFPCLDAGAFEERIADGNAQALRHWIGKLALASPRGAAVTSGEAERPPTVSVETLRELRRQWSEGRRAGTRRVRVAMGPGTWLERRKGGFYWEIRSPVRNGASARGKKECPPAAQRIILDHGAGDARWRWGDQEYTLTVRCFPRPAELRFPGPREGRAIFDAGLFSCTLQVRTRKDGDRFSPLGTASESRKLKVFLNEMKIPAGVRDELPLVFAGRPESSPNASGGEILAWVPGHGTSHFFKVGAQTTHILEMELTCRNP